MEERRQKFDRCLQSAESLVSELKAYNWPELVKDGTLSYVTRELTRLLRLLRLSPALGRTADVPPWTFDALLQYANEMLQGTSRAAFLSSLEKSFDVQVVSPGSIERRLKPIRHYKGVKR